MIKKLLLLFALTFLCCIKAGSRAPLENPNIVVFFVDDLGYGDLGITGHPTTKTPNIDLLAEQGMRLTTWYSGYPVCSASRTSLLTGRYVGRTGMPGVLGNSAEGGLPLNETTLSEYLKKKGYATAAIGKWHLGQRPQYLPGNRAFDHYLGIPYSVDMGTMARETPCNGSGATRYVWIDREDTIASMDFPEQAEPGVPLPLVQQEFNKTTILEQPLDLTTLSPKYAKYALKFLEENKNKPFFLYFPFSHVHVAGSYIKPDGQYASCSFINSTDRGRFGDGLAEVDWTIGQVVDFLQKNQLMENTFIVFTSDNGPWLEKKLGSGSVGTFLGQASGYWNTGKGSTWEGGVREPAFAVWKGQIEPNTYSDEIVSSLDVVPTVLKLAGIPLPTDRVIDGKDFFPVTQGKKSEWETDHLYHYWGKDIHAVRYGRWKAHFITAPGLGGCSQPNCKEIKHDPPLLFDLLQDPGEAYPVTGQTDLLNKLVAAKNKWESEFVFGHIPGGSGWEYAVCCDRTKECVCTP